MSVASEDKVAQVQLSRERFMLCRAVTAKARHLVLETWPIEFALVASRKAWHVTSDLYRQHPSASCP